MSVIHKITSMFLFKFANSVHNSTSTMPVVKCLILTIQNNNARDKPNCTSAVTSCQ